MSNGKTRLIACQLFLIFFLFSRHVSLRLSWTS